MTAEGSTLICLEADKNNMETAIGIGIWVTIFLVWYLRNYPERLQRINPLRGVKVKWPRMPKKRNNRKHKRTFKATSPKDYKRLVEIVETISSRDAFLASDAAAMVEAVHTISEIEPATGQIWEAFSLNALEDAEITCDDCRIPVQKTIKKTGVKIECPSCGKWLALRNSKVTIIDPHRSDLEEWEK